MHFTESRSETARNRADVSRQRTGGEGDFSAPRDSASADRASREESQQSPEKSSMPGASQSMSSSSTPPAVPPLPAFLRQRRTKAAEQDAEETARQQLAATIVTEDEELPLSRRLALWFASFAAMGYGMSLILHAAVLAILSLSIVHGIEGYENFSTLLTESDTQIMKFDVLETAVDPAGGALRSETSPVPMNVTELLDDDSQVTSILPDAPHIPTEASDGDGDNSGDNNGDGEDAEGQLFRLPESGRAITKGSFTAWTIPEDPEPKQSYLIVIQIRLPEGTRRYRASDLSGFIKGTDGFTQAIPWDRFYPTNAIVLRGSTMRPINARSYLPIKDGVAQLAIKVLPPNYEEARKRGITTVQDTIMIQSRRLAEKQTLSIEF